MLDDVGGAIALFLFGSRNSSNDGAALIRESDQVSGDNLTRDSILRVIRRIYVYILMRKVLRFRL